MKKLNIWDSSFLAANYNIASQAVAKITKVCEGGVDVNTLPPSMFPTESLYNICAGFTAMYETLLDQQLLKAGNKKQANQIH
jgi:hypothetical protein